MKKRFAPLVLSILTLVFLLACTEDPDQLYTKAQTEARLGSRQQALNYLLQIQANNPEYVEAYTFAADLFLEDGNVGEAIAQLKRGLDARADSAVLTHAIGRIYHRAEDLDQAYNYYKQAAVFNPELETIQISLAEVLYAKELYQQAADHYTRALNLNPANYAARIGMGLVQRQLGETGRAIELLEAAIEAESMRGEAYGALAYTEELTGQPREAIAENYELAVRLTPTDQRSWKWYLDFAAADTNAQSAIRVHQRYSKQFPDDLNGHHRLTELYIDLALQEGLSWLDAARAQCDKAFLVSSDDAVSHANMARIYLLQEKPRLALLEAQLAFEIQPTSEFRELVDRAKFLLD